MTCENCGKDRKLKPFIFAYKTGKKLAADICKSCKQAILYKLKKENE